MSVLTAQQFIDLAQTARWLNEPGEINNEYVRGQVNLLADVAGIPDAVDLIGDVLTRYITHQTDDLAMELLDVFRAYLRS